MSDHEPNGDREAADAGDDGRDLHRRNVGGAAPGPATAGETPPRGGRDRTFGWRGWVLVGMIVVAFLVVPAVLYALPRVGGLVAVGLPLRDAYLVLPLVPAVLLAVLAVWATTRP